VHTSLVDLMERVRRGRVQTTPPAWKTRGRAWTLEQQREFLRLVLDGLPVPPLLLWNDVCLDGENGLCALDAFYHQGLAVDGRVYQGLGPRTKERVDMTAIGLCTLQSDYWTEATASAYVARL
jgi:hypothetical protein